MSMYHDYANTQEISKQKYKEAWKVDFVWHYKQYVCLRTHKINWTLHRCFWECFCINNFSLFTSTIHDFAKIYKFIYEHSCEQGTVHRERLFIIWFNLNLLSNFVILLFSNEGGINEIFIVKRSYTCTWISDLNIMNNKIYHLNDHWVSVYNDS